MNSLKSIPRRACAFVLRIITAWRYMRRLNYSRKLAWAMAAR